MRNSVQCIKRAIRNAVRSAASATCGVDNEISDSTIPSGGGLMTVASAVYRREGAVPFHR